MLCALSTARSHLLLSMASSLALPVRLCSCLSRATMAPTPEVRAAKGKARVGLGGLVWGWK